MTTIEILFSIVASATIASLVMVALGVWKSSKSDGLEPVPNNPGVRIDADGEMWYSAAWLDDYDVIIDDKEGN